MIPAFPAYLFDVDGTLVDSASDICGAIQGVLADTECPDISFEFLQGYIGRHLIDLFRDIFPRYSDQQIDILVERYRAIYPLRNHSSTRVYDHVLYTLTKLPGKKSTATTKSTQTTIRVLELFELRPFFDHVQGTDAFPAKPEPDVLIRALQGLQVDRENALFVGDSAADMEAAQRAGIRSCAVTYGYGKREDLARWNPTYWINDPRELLPEYGG